MLSRNIHRTTPSISLFANISHSVNSSSNAIYNTTQSLHTSNTRFSASSKDPYQVLGVSRTASSDDIKKQYRVLAKKYHPDLNKEPEAAAKMAEVAAAYETLNNPEKRQMYDQTGMNPDEMGNMDFGGMGGMGGFGFNEFADLFGFMNQQQQRNAPRRGADLAINLDISFMEAIQGCQKELVYDAMLKCGDCHGSGAKPGTKASHCKACDGSGIRQMARGPMIVGVACNVCRGSGTVIECPCKSCKGATVRREEVRVKVDIPSGVDDSMELKLGDHGHAGENGGRRGNLFVKIRVAKHPTFHRKADTLYVYVKLPIMHMLMGGAVTVPTLEGNVKLDYPKGKFESTTRLRNRGVRSLHGGGRGDLCVMYELEVPTNLSDEQKAILYRFNELEKAKAEGTAPPLPNSSYFFRAAETTSQKTSGSENGATVAEEQDTASASNNVYTSERKQSNGEEEDQKSATSGLQ